MIWFPCIHIIRRLEVRGSGDQWRLYHVNTGEGIQHHHSLKNKKGQQKYLPFVRSMPMLRDEIFKLRIWYVIWESWSVAQVRIGESSESAIIIGKHLCVVTTYLRDYVR